MFESAFNLNPINPTWDSFFPEFQALAGKITRAHIDHACFMPIKHNALTFWHTEHFRNVQMCFLKVEESH